MSCNSNYSTDSSMNIPYRTALLPTKQDSKMAQTCFRQDHKTANDRYQWTQRQKQEEDTPDMKKAKPQ